MVYENSAGAVIYREENGKRYFLLLHYSSGHWEFMKGHVEKGENELDTVRREAEEETGIKDLKIIEGFKEQINYIYKRDKEMVFKTVNFYLAKTRTKNVKISYEHQGFEWLEYNDALERLTFKNAKNVLIKAEEKIRNLNKTKNS